jgi:hypothetical protein
MQERGTEIPCLVFPGYRASAALCHHRKDQKSSPFYLFHFSLSKAEKAFILMEAGGQKRRDLEDGVSMDIVSFRKNGKE